MSTKGKTVLLTGGRAPVTLELARAFALAGWRVVVAESLPVHLCRSSRAVARSVLVPAPRTDPQAFIDALDAVICAEGVDLLIPTCEEIFHIARGIEQLRARCRVLAEPLDSLRRLHSKWEFVGQVVELGLPAPATELITSREALQSRLDRRRADEGLVLKPVFSRFAARVYLLRAHRAVEVPEVWPTPEQPWLAQQLLEGEPFCTYSVAHGGRLTAHVAYGSRFTAGEGATIAFAPAHRPDLERWVARFVEATGFTGQIAFDFIVAPDGTPYPLECNPRATSGIHLLPPAGLVQALTQPDSPLIGPEPSARAILRMAMLLYGRPFRSWARLREWADLLVTARDVVYRADDPAPFRDQFRLMARFWQISRKRSIGLTEATTADIEWNGEA